MQILVVGAASSIGKSIVKRIEQSHSMIRSSRKNSDLNIDLSSDQERIEIPLGTDVVINLSASYGGTSAEAIIEAERVNVIGLASLMQASVKANVKHFVQISSVSALLKPTSAFFSAYSLSKKHSEEIALLLSSKCKLPLTILRPTRIYGNGAEFRSGQPFIFHALDQARTGNSVVIYGSHDPKRNYMHIDDLTEIVDRVIEKRVLGVYTCTFPRDVSFGQIISAAFAAHDRSGKIVFDTNQKDIPDNIFGCDPGFYQLIGFTPKITIEEGIRMITSSQVS